MRYYLDININPKVEHLLSKDIYFYLIKDHIETKKGLYISDNKHYELDVLVVNENTRRIFITL